MPYSLNRNDDIGDCANLFLRMRHWYDKRVETIGRGFLAVRETSGEVRVAHETMLTFWRELPRTGSKGKGQELLLIACASCFVAVGRRYPQLTDVDARRPTEAVSYSEAIRTSHQNSKHIFEHIFGRLALRNPPSNDFTLR